MMLLNLKDWEEITTQAYLIKGFSLGSHSCFFVPSVLSCLHWVISQLFQLALNSIYRILIDGVALFRPLGDSS